MVGNFSSWVIVDLDSHSNGLNSTWNVSIKNCKQIIGVHLPKNLFLFSFRYNILSKFIYLSIIYSRILENKWVAVNLTLIYEHLWYWGAPLKLMENWVLWAMKHHYKNVVFVFAGNSQFACILHLPLWKECCCVMDSAAVVTCALVVVSYLIFVLLGPSPDLEYALFLVTVVGWWLKFSHWEKASHAVKTCWQSQAQWHTL